MNELPLIPIALPMSLPATVIGPLDYTPGLILILGIIAACWSLAVLAKAKRAAKSPLRSMVGLLCATCLIAVTSGGMYYKEKNSRLIHRFMKSREQIGLIQTESFIYLGAHDRGWPEARTNAALIRELCSSESCAKRFRESLRSDSTGNAIDPRDRPYFIRFSEAGGLTVHSSGDDGIAGTEDDIAL